MKPKFNIGDRVIVTFYGLNANAVITMNGYINNGDVEPFYWCKLNDGVRILMPESLIRLADPKIRTAEEFLAQAYPTSLNEIKSFATNVIRVLKAIEAYADQFSDATKKSPCLMCEGNMKAELCGLCDDNFSMFRPQSMYTKKIAPDHVVKPNKMFTEEQMKRVGIAYCRYGLNCFIDKSYNDTWQRFIKSPEYKQAIGGE